MADNANPKPANRETLIGLLVESGAPLTKINTVLTEKGFEPIADAEAIKLGLKLPENFTAADLTGAAPAPVEKKAKKVQAAGCDPLYNIPTLDIPLPQGEYTDAGVLKAGPVVGAANIKGTATEINALAAQVISMTAAISKILKIADPYAFAFYKKMKEEGEGDERQRKARAYAWAFARLLQLGYLPNG